MCRSCRPGPKDRVIQKIKLDAGHDSICSRRRPRSRAGCRRASTTTFWLTNNPYGESFEHLQYLVHYPYGCIEQTTSSTRPLLYVGSLVEQVDPQLAELKIEDMVLSGINRVLSMETPSGGFGYWPGATEPLEWATAYATHMLLDAKKAGYAVPDDRLAEVLDWIEGRVAQYERGEYVAARQVEPLRRAVRGVPPLRARARRQGSEGAHPEADRVDSGRREGRGTPRTSTC